MEKCILSMKWSYEYDKEGTWFDTDSGEEEYEIFEGESFPLPHISKKCLNVESVRREGETLLVEIYVDSHTVTVKNDGKEVTASVSDSYSVAGDSVHQSLDLSFSIKT